MKEATVKAWIKDINSQQARQVVDSANEQGIQIYNCRQYFFGPLGLMSAVLYIYIGSLSIDFSVLQCSMVMISPILRWGKKQRKYTFHSYKPVFFFFITHAQPFDSDACAMFRPMSTWRDVMTDELKLSRCQISTDTVYITLKTY